MAPGFKYDRRVSLIITSDSGSFDLSDFRITFQVNHASVSTPKTLRARIYNLSHGGGGSANTIATIQSATNKVVSLSAYYASQQPSVLFTGQVRQIYAGRESPVDTYLDIGASAFEQFHAEAQVSGVLAAGWTHEDVFNNILINPNANEYGISAGSFPNISGSGARPKVCYGNVRDLTRSLARNTASIMFQHDSGRIDMVPIAQTAAASTNRKMFLSPKNGLINIPVQIPEGIQATALLDSRLQLGTVVSIYTKNNSDSLSEIVQSDVDLSYAGTNGGNQAVDSNGNSYVTGLDHNGDYTILYVDHTGDTRGDTWYTTLVGQAVDPSDQSVITSNAAGAV